MELLLAATAFGVLNFIASLFGDLIESMISGADVIGHDQLSGMSDRLVPIGPNILYGVLRSALLGCSQSRHFADADWECWIDSFFVAAPKALETIGKTLHAQYGRWQPKDMEDRLVELEAIQKVLLEGTAYDKMQADMIVAKERLAKILQSKDKKATLLDMVEQNELDRPLLTLLDENIANANKYDQKQAAEYMEKIRSAVLKYMTV